MIRTVQLSSSQANAPQHTLELKEKDATHYQVLWDGVPVEADVESLPGGCFSIIIEGKQFQIDADVSGEELVVERQAFRHGLSLLDPRLKHASKGKGGAGGPVLIKSPMPGKVIRLLVQKGDEVKAGQGIVVVEAMKMQNELKSPANARIADILVKEGANVETHAKLVKLEVLGS